MSFEIKRAGIIGAGTMGAAIAAHFANVGIPSLLLDVPGDGEGHAARNAIAQRGLERALKARPATFYDSRDARLIAVGNTEDDWAKLSECDLIVEAIVERLDAKRALFQRLAGVRAPDTIVASNTSGISINAMAAGLPDEMRRNMLVLHFFNPVRYMKLLEIVPGRDTDPAVVEAASRFGTNVLGKGVVLGKDTPNFIANRLGVYGFMKVLKRALDEGYPFDEVDAILGEAMGRASSAIFRTCDLSGLDVLLHVAQGVYDNAPDDEEREVFNPPPLLREMVARGWLGEKSGQGFFKRIRGEQGSEILVLDPHAMEYHPRQKYRFASIGAVRENPDPAARVRGIVGGDDRASAFARATTLDLLAYTARRVPEIADSPADVDDAMRWGYRWSIGPFETYDALGTANVARMMEDEGRAVPALVQEVLERHDGRFYHDGEGTRRVFVPGQHGYVPLPSRPSDLTAAALAAGGAVRSDNGGARLLDMGDGVALVEFRTKLNTIDTDVMATLQEALQRAGRDYRAIVIGNDAADFSVGANIATLLMAAHAGAWDQIEPVVKGFQDVNMALKYSPVPVVVAPAGRTLGGGCEIVLHGAKVRAAAETYLGLVETGVGLIPAGGGCKETLLRLREIVLDGGPFPPVRRAFETIAYATVSTSAKEARNLGYLRRGDEITLDRDRLLHDAKADAVALAEQGYAPPSPERATLQLPGEGGRLVIEQQLNGLRQAGKISDHDVLVGQKLAYVLTGGAASPLDVVTEEYVLELEREAFLSLLGTPKTLERMAHTLTTGKPLRN